MAKRDAPGGFELQVLLAIMRLGEDAYGVPIADTIEAVISPNVSNAGIRPGGYHGKLYRSS